MKKIQVTAIAFTAIVLGGIALAQQDKYALKVPGGLAFSEFRGYEGWQVVANQSERKKVRAGSSCDQEELNGDTTRRRLQIG